MQTKTNVVRILEANGISHNVFTYEAQDGKIDGVSVAEKIGKDPECVYKTLITQGTSNAVYVCVIPVGEELDLKKVAKAIGEKRVEMVPVKAILGLTGYIRGGCSPIGMKKQYKTFIDKSAVSLDTLVVSGGKIGIQVELGVEALQHLTNAAFADLVKD